MEREALNIIFGMKKFHQYLYGHKFTLLTDHKPLLTIFNTRKGIPTVLQRWAIILSAYTYDIQYKPTRQNRGEVDLMDVWQFPTDVRVLWEVSCGFPDTKYIVLYNFQFLYLGQATTHVSMQSTSYGQYPHVKHGSLSHVNSKVHLYDNSETPKDTSVVDC